MKQKIIGIEVNGGGKRTLLRVLGSYRQWTINTSKFLNETNQSKETKFNPDAPYLGIFLGCGCTRKYWKKRDISYNSERCKHGNYFIKYNKKTKGEIK